MLDKVKFFYYFFQLLGLCPIYLRKFGGIPINWAVVFNVIHLIFLIVQFIISYDSSSIFIYQKDVMGQFNDILKFLSSMINYLFILIESWLQRDHHKYYWQTVIQLNMDHKPAMNLWPYIYHFGGSLLFTVATQFLFLRVSYNSIQVIYYIQFYMIGLMVSSVRHLQYILYLDIIHTLEKNLYEKLLRLDHQGTDKKVKVHFNELREIKLYYQSIYDLVESVNNAFGCSQMINLIHCFIQLLVDLYWCHYRIYNKMLDCYFCMFLLQLYYYSINNLIAFKMSYIQFRR